MCSPLVSVIIPTYNRGYVITRAIHSVLSQSYSNYELIIVDDGSYDNTKDILHAYTQHIQYIYQSNAGVSVARNVGIRTSKGQWVAFLDSDDEWLPEYLESQIFSINQQPHASIHMTNSYQITESLEIINTFERKNILNLFDNRQHICINDAFIPILKYHLASPINTVINRSCLQDTELFNADLSIYEDIDLIARVSLKGPVCLSRKPLVKYYLSDKYSDNLSGQYYTNPLFARSCVDLVYNNLNNSLCLTPYQHNELRKIICNNKACIGNLYLSQGKKPQARQYFKTAYIVYPSFKSFLRLFLNMGPFPYIWLFLKARFRIFRLSSS